MIDVDTENMISLKWDKGNWRKQRWSPLSFLFSTKGKFSMTLQQYFSLWEERRWLSPVELRPANPQCKSHRLSTGTNPNASLFYIQNSDQRPQRYFLCHLPVVLTISPGSLVLVAITILKISLKSWTVPKISPISPTCISPRPFLLPLIYWPVYLSPLGHSNLETKRMKLHKRNQIKEIPTKLVEKWIATFPGRPLGSSGSGLYTWKEISGS